MPPYKTVCVSLYVEELVAIDAKVDALKAMGFLTMSRSKLIRMAALALGEAELAERLPPLPPPPEPKRKAPSTPGLRTLWFAGRRCGKCGIHGHDRRTCMGVEKESRL